MTKENRQALTKKHEKNRRYREAKRSRTAKHASDHPELYGGKTFAEYVNENYY